MSVDPIVIRQSRAKIALACVGAAVFFVLGVSFVTRPEWWVTHGSARVEIELIGWPAVVFSAFCIVFGVLYIARPTVVTLSKSGMTVLSIWKSYARPWSSLSNFHIWQLRGVKRIVFDDREPAFGSRWSHLHTTLRGANSSLPPFLGGDLEQTLKIIQTAKSNWSSH